MDIKNSKILGKKLEGNFTPDIKIEFDGYNETLFGSTGYVEFIKNIEFITPKDKFFSLEPFDGSSKIVSDFQEETGLVKDDILYYKKDLIIESGGVFYTVTPDSLKTGLKIFSIVGLVSFKYNNILEILKDKVGYDVREMSYAEKDLDVKPDIEVEIYNETYKYLKKNVEDKWSYLAKAQHWSNNILDVLDKYGHLMEESLINRLKMLYKMSPYYDQFVAKKRELDYYVPIDYVGHIFTKDELKKEGINDLVFKFKPHSGLRYIVPDEYSRYNFLYEYKIDRYPVIHLGYCFSKKKDLYLIIDKREDEIGLYVPKECVGSIIGKRGANIKQVEKEHGIKIYISEE